MENFSSVYVFCSDVRAPAIARKFQQVYPLPDWLPLVCAPAIPACYATVYCALVEKGQLKNGEVLLVLAAAGGVGLAACQMGKALGATVIAVASTKEKLDICRMEGGADYLINYHEDQNWEKTVNQITKKMGKAWEGADVIIDPVGNPTQTLKCIARNGRLIVVGFAGRGAIPETDRIKAAQLPPLPTMQMNRLMLKNIEVKGIAW